MLKTRVIVAAILIAIMILLLFVLPPICMAIFIAAAAAIGSFELMRATKSAEKKSMYVWPAMTAFAIPIGTYFGVQEITIKICLSALMVFLFAEAVFTYGNKNQVSFSAIFSGFFGGLIIPVCMAALVSMKLLENGSIIILMAFVITAVSDSGAYFVGMSMGKHRGILKASPNKSLEGFIGSVFGGIIGIMIFGLIIQFAMGLTVNYIALLLYALLGNVTTQLGDLAFSVIKRQNGIKDYGKLMPGHGGVLDRLDSMIFTGPVVLMLFTAFPAF